MSVIYNRAQSNAVPRHAIAVLVTPAIVIVSSSVAAASVITTATPHHYVTGDTVAIAGHAGSTPPVDGSRVVIVIDALHFSIALAVTMAGAGGTVTRALAREPLTLADAKLWAGLDWADGDAREALLTIFIAAARKKVQQDTGVVPLLQTFDVYFDALPTDRTPIALPWRPVPSVTSLIAIDSAGVPQTLDASNYVLDPSSDAPVSARVGLSTTGRWPTDLRSFQPYVLRIVAGHPSIAALPSWVVHAVGLLTAHYATVGRDLASRDPVAEVPLGYADLIAPYCPVVVA